MTTVNTAVTRVSANTSTGTQDVTVSGFGDVKFFTVKIISATSDGVEGSDILLSSGFCDGVNSVASSIASQDAVATSNSSRRSSSILAAVVNPSNSGIDIAITFDSFITNGVRIDIFIAPPAAYLMEFTFFGGDGVLNATAGTLLLDSLGDSVNVGYAPSFAIVESVGNGALNGGVIHGLLSHGIAVNDGSNTQSSIQFFDEDNVTTSDSGTFYDSNSVVGQYFDGTQAWAANVIFNSTGWTWGGLEGNDYITYLAVELASDIEFSLQSFDTPTSTGTSTLGSTSFTPAFASLCLSSNSATGASSNGGNGFGSYSAAGGFGIGYHSVDALSTTDCKTISVTNKLLVESSSNIARYEADFLGFTSTGIEFDFTTVDATARKGFGLFIGNPSAGVNSAILDFEVVKPVFSSTVESVRPEFNSTIDIDISNPEFSVSATTSFTINALVDFDINKPAFSVDATTAEPEFNSDVDIQISKPLFSSTAETIKPEFNSIADLNISKPVFSVSASSLFLIQSTVDFDVDKPIFSASAESVKPEFNSNINFDLDAPLFSVSAENIANESNAGASIAIQKPVFSATAGSEKPEFNSTVDATISAPMFSATVINGIITLQFNEETNFNQPHLSTNVNQVSLSTNVDQPHLSTNIDRN